MSIQVLHGDCRDVLLQIPDASVQMVCTSPPYYLLRDANDPGQIGMEDTPEQYLAALVAVFRHLRRVLKDDGLVFLNLGDGYGRKQRLMIPARAALALQADGWILRDEIVWHKPRPTPAPVLDRTVAAHEMIYLLTKQTRYYFDYLAIEEPSAYPGVKRKAGKAFRDLQDVDPNAARKRPGADREIIVRDTRRKRSVWSVSPTPYKDGHFSTMPPEIAETCIKAGSRIGDTVLDPFYGAGTTGLVADRLQRNCIGIELIAGNNERSTARVMRDSPLFAQVT